MRICKPMLPATQAGNRRQDVPLLLTFPCKCTCLTVTNAFEDYIINIILSPFSLPLVLVLLNQWCTPPIRFQVSDCSTSYHVRCPQSSCFLRRESTECSPGIVSRIFSPSVTVPVALMIVDMTKHFIFHIPRILSISICILLPFSLFFMTFLSDCIAMSINDRILSVVFNYCVWILIQNFCIGLYPLIP
jgi:hypothetical protein